MALGAPESLETIMNFQVYILWSDSIKKFYVGSTSNLAGRFSQHNRGQSKFTLKVIPWSLLWSAQYVDRSEAIRVENKIKKSGIRRFLEDINFDFSGCSAAR